MATDSTSILLARHKNVSTSYEFLATTDYTTAASKITGKASWTIYILRIVLAVTVDNAATQQWQDSAGTPVPVAKSKASPGLGPIIWDFGEDGIALTEGKDFQHIMSATGMAGAVNVTAYMRPTSALVANIAGTTGGL